MLSLVVWAYLRHYATTHLLEQHSSLNEPQQEFLDKLGTHLDTHHHVATVQGNQSHQYWRNDTTTSGCRVNLTSFFRHIPLSARRGVNLWTWVDLGGWIGVVNLNHCCAANEGPASTIMRFGDNSSNLSSLLTEQSANIEVSAAGSTSGGQVSSLVDHVASATSATSASETNINDSVVGVVGRPSGVGGAEDAFSMNITPALSQVRMDLEDCYDETHGVSGVVDCNM